MDVSKPYTTRTAQQIKKYEKEYERIFGRKKNKTKESKNK